MIIRYFEKEDFDSVVYLLATCGVEPPQELDELMGPCFVSEVDGEIVGIIFALAGASTKAYVDYLAIKEEHRGTPLFFALLSAMERELKERGIKRYMFHIELYNTKAIEQLQKYGNKYSITQLRNLHYFSREIA